MQRPWTANAATRAVKQGFWSSATSAPLARPQTASLPHRGSLGLRSAAVQSPEQMQRSVELPVSPVRDRMKHAVHRESALRCEPRSLLLLPCIYWCVLMCCCCCSRAADFQAAVTTLCYVSTCADDTVHCYLHSLIWECATGT